ncbi:EscU/YscU/HrcU family type III secretion system export apparatus switch protein [Phenylobacterium sp.]|uniref:EscU/YscU/HrcU family type III secretion system export apparatus switch protein n=1 Tax=Phenylobacterium sp. TaxID=1871053 RepID=UPI00286DB5DE|nr:EscU/YscU/HrcU family type III secretion system export apparatus switch protein [Phenylobacterium sp.]
MSKDLRLAVALKYDAPGAPRVVAAGRGLVGERIIAAAEAHGVPLEHNPLLAEALSKVEVDSEIPERLFVAVAEILAFLMRKGPEAKTL